MIDAGQLNGSGSALPVVEPAVGKPDSQRGSATSRSSAWRAKPAPNRLGLHRRVVSPIAAAASTRFATDAAPPRLGCGEVLAW